MALKSSNGCEQLLQNRIALHAVEPNSLLIVVFTDLH